MNILIVGSGGREAAIAWKLKENPRVESLFRVPATSVEEVLKKAKDLGADLTIVGSEELLVAGIVDAFEKENLAIFGPNKKAAILEGSKAYAKDFMQTYGVKTARYKVFSEKDYEEALAYLEEEDYPLVIKASGLAAGKGVLICKSLEEARKALEGVLLEGRFAEAGKEVLIEEFLEGVEASILSFTDGKSILPCLSAKDHKKIGEGETGPNTGGMGVIAPNPYVTKEVLEEFQSEILEKTLEGMKQEGMDFAGVIFFGLMMTTKGVYLLEYNMRLGDPETQALLPLLETDLLEVIEAAMERRLEEVELSWKKKASCCLVLASGGYPGKYETGFEIQGLEEVDCLSFLAGAIQKGNKVFTRGGRVLNLVALGDSLEEAKKRVYEEVKKVSFQDMYYRKDIGKMK